jgi:HEAT repeat protein
MTLSTMGLAEYKRDIAELLKSKSSVDKQGANYALAKLKATEYAEQIAGQLSGPQVEFLRDGSAIHALIDLGVGQKYKKQIGLVLTAANSSDVKKPAMYALAHLHATESAPAIATLLAENYLRADAAKALAIMGDHEHEAEIAAMIDDKDESAQSAAILALGILGARQYAPMIAKLLGKKESSVSYDAALSLLLMGAADYEREAAARLSTNKTGTYVSVNNFNGFNVLVADEVKEINKRVVLALERVKKQ